MISLFKPQVKPAEVVRRGIIGNIQDPDKQVQQVGIDLTVSTKVVLEPHKFQNVELSESFDMQDTFGLLWIRSSLSRKGVFMSCGVFDPGFKGVGGISLYNFSDSPIVIEDGFRICQMIVFRASPQSMYDGFYNKTKSVTSQYKEAHHRV